MFMFLAKKKRNQDVVNQVVNIILISNLLKKNRTDSLLINLT